MPRTKNHGLSKRRKATIITVGVICALAGALFLTTMAVGVTSAVVAGGSSARLDAGEGHAVVADPAGQQAAGVTSTPTAPVPAPTPKVTHKTVQKTTEIPFASSTVDDPNRDSGTSAVVTAGQNGTATETWDVVMTDGVETARSLVSTTAASQPVAEVTAVGTRQQPVAAPEPEPEPEPEADAPSGSGCDPNYEGACVPIDSDVDCAGGSGNGPSYVEGPVQVVGTDIYKLDSDHDGVGCE